MTSNHDQQRLQIDEPPEVDAERCVHSQLVSATCRACVDVCPRDAWVITDDALGLIEDACDRCAKCLPACPQTAIKLRQERTVIPADDQASALFACEVAVAEPGAGVRRCLHAIGLSELAHLYNKGVRRLIVCRGACEHCNRGAGQQFDQSVRDLQLLLADRMLPEFELVEQSLDNWLETRSLSLRTTRRGFLTGLRRLANAENVASEVDAPLPAACLLPSGDCDAPLVPYQPLIDSENCIACDACTRVCQTQAIALEVDGENRAAYRIDPRRCTGCELCIDICEVGATSLGHWRHAPQTAIHLDTKQCRSCGNVLRVPNGSANAEKYCRICSKTRHNSKLYQVLP